MAAEEDGIDVLQSYGRLGIVDSRHRGTVIAQIMHKFPDMKGPHGWEHRIITVPDIFGSTGGSFTILNP